MRIAPPGAAEGEIARLRPHLIVRTDDDGLDPEALAGVPTSVEVLYTDSMASRVSVGDRSFEIEDTCMDDLLAIVDEAEAVASGPGSEEASQGRA